MAEYSNRSRGSLTTSPSIARGAGRRRSRAAPIVPFRRHGAPIPKPTEGLAPLLLSRGEIVHCGTPAELMADEVVKSRYLGVA